MPVILLIMLVMYLVLAVLITTVLRLAERVAAKRLGRAPVSRARRIGDPVTGSV